MVLLEVCVETAAGARAAQAGGAGRIELCADLVEGGTTPSAGAIARTRALTTLPLVVLVRPRPGDFVHDEDELAAMEHDVRVARELGADGVALGTLTAEGTVDEAATARLVACARPLSVTFHRAFDLTADPRAALATLLELGVERLLTSGQRDSVVDGLPLVAELVAAAGERLVVVPAGGVREHNLAAVLAATGAREVHVSARRTVATRQRRGASCRLGSAGAPPAAGADAWAETDAALVRRLVAAATG